uniref:LAGLIDADG homing endonuclease type 2 n=3 Tax=Glomeraceae TaxID=36751 RepID=I6XNU8_9GLOM|nr:hypothetical protein [Glomus sp. DAOM 229456]AFN42490.1 LAGLIDADG homing endonuclease type 2 [Rhizophagus irregularis]AGJ98058.1 LAGLIDADG endonuclease [Glomus sp. DAOM 240422]
MQTQFASIFSRFYRVSAKVNMVITPVLHEILVGSMLGDLTAERNNIRSNTRLHFKQSIINREYIEHLYSLFQDYCGSPPKTMSKFDSRPDKMKEYGAIKFVTLSLPCFNIYRELFYNSEGKKILPENLEELLTARSLAYWIMDDGYKHRKALYISTESFSLDENEFLVKILKNKFDLDCSAHPTTNGNRVYIFSSSRERLKDLIHPYLLPHFYYKLDLDSSL